MTKVAINGAKGKMGLALIDSINLNKNVNFGSGFDKETALISHLMTLTF